MVPITGRIRSARALGLAGLTLAAVLAAGVACGGGSTRIELASDRFDLPTVSASDVLAASRNAVSGLSSYTFEATYETNIERVSMEGVWEAPGRTAYTIGEAGGLSEIEIDNGGVVYSGTSLFRRRAGSAGWTETALLGRLTHPPFGSDLPPLKNLVFVERGVIDDDLAIWIKGDLASPAPVYLPGGDRDQPGIFVAVEGQYTFVINKFDLFVDTIIATLSVKKIDPASDIGSLDLSDGVTTAAFVYSFADFNEPVAIVVPPAPPATGPSPAG